MANTEPRSDAPRTEKVSFSATDGHPLVGELFLPPALEVPGVPKNMAADPTTDTSAAAQPRIPAAAAVIHPATGVDMNLYRKFAAYLAEEKGWPTLIYDFRGCGFSERPGDRADPDMVMADWMLKDVPAATGWIRRRFPDVPILAVGHSVGAHGQAAVGQREAPVDAQVMIASHAGITNLVRGRRERAKVWTIFNVITPLTARILGHVPVALFGMGRNIPLGVMRQWAGWTKKPGYFFDDATYDFAARYEQLRGSVLSVVFSDDPWANRRAVDVLTDRMTNADVEKMDVQVGPNGQIAGPVDHMGFFRSKNKQLWPKVGDWLEAQIDTSPPRF
ncbi:alpha/beta hydrolase family protein [Corynebacterium heidelbergense]|uniref:Phosphoheptose isomerase n=1 Tax=Corynebacterium heidelbergense TaxID=2055947 RepID=A0A364V8J9_9CORY|nr:alpha/beta fold hydrolase [Corynebacterium heidelbergense]RAV32982.1 phosphoheptose isomerase [Corynebacterium heidelbergense]